MAYALLWEMVFTVRFNQVHDCKQIGDTILSHSVMCLRKDGGNIHNSFETEKLRSA